MGVTKPPAEKQSQCTFNDKSHRSQQILTPREDATENRLAQDQEKLSRRQHAREGFTSTKQLAFKPKLLTNHAAWIRLAQKACTTLHAVPLL